MNDDSPQSATLDARLASLSRETAPPHDLWPEIEARIRPPAPRRWPFAVAALLAVATLAALTGWQAGRRFAVGSPAATAGDASLARPDPALPQGRGYLAARTVLERTYQQRLPLLDLKTRLRIQQDLATIQAANADIRRALAADPQSPVLNRLLEGIWQQEFDLYVAVARNTQFATKETGI